MRRAQAILIIIALLATPLALLARSADGSMSGCTGMCCPTHRSSHAARVLPEKMLCHHGEAGHLFNCTMMPGHHGIDYGLIAPVAPTSPSAVAFISAPDVSRATAGRLHEVATSGFLSTPLQPPRP
ncbi:MAG: hypothetical protein WCD49_11035 [Candidatus Acidiferrales bacterium]